MEQKKNFPTAPDLCFGAVMILPPPPDSSATPRFARVFGEAWFTDLV